MSVFMCACIRRVRAYMCVCVSGCVSASVRSYMRACACEFLSVCIREHVRSCVRVCVSV